jgi:aldehyde dehydrogenase (NAD+)
MPDVGGGDDSVPMDALHQTGRLYVGGEWVVSAADGWIAVDNPATEEVIAAVPLGTAEDVARAVSAARCAFPAWSATPVAERARYLEALRDALAATQDELAATITAEMGAPTKVARAVQTGVPLQVLSAYVELAGRVEATETIGNSVVVREPVGVVAAITPWNYPLHQSIAKIAPALLAGCTVVHKPSEVAPLTAYAVAEIADSIGLPPGVYNLVSGTGEVVGEALARHPDVDMVSFTGSTRAGRRVGALASETVKRVALELGGKSANVILDDADITAAVKVGVANCFLNSGQTCTAWTRMLAPDSRYDEIVELAAATAAAYTVGDPTDPATRLGPLASAAQRERVNGYVAEGMRDGGRVVAGAPGADGLPSRGYYVRGTVFADVDPEATIAQEEIFGPVLSIIRYTDEDDAVRIANATQYGLAGAVWSADGERALRVARRLRTGQVDINGARFNPSAPFGGYRQSGIGRELGRHGLEEFQLLKAMQLP